jgi:hypothetical protein
MKRRGVETAKDATKIADSAKSEVVENASKEAHKVELSDDVKKKLKKDVKTLGKAGGHLAKDAAASLANAIPKPIPLSIPTFNKNKAAEAKSVEDVKELMPVDKPALFFLSGLHLATFSSDETGIPEMAKAVKGAEHFSWQDEDKLFEEILKRPESQPVVLVGHSLGGDAVVNLANRLNTLEGGFRKVDLLVTLDSVGFGNDIIPQNVKKNMNFISDKDYFYNDGPNIARSVKNTEVVNYLRNEGHREIDEAQDVHFEILSNIKEVMKKSSETSQFQKLTELFSKMQDAKNIANPLKSDS